MFQEVTLVLSDQAAILSVDLQVQVAIKVLFQAVICLDSNNNQTCHQLSLSRVCQSRA
jgi:hypothetical protein